MLQTKKTRGWRDLEIELDTLIKDVNNPIELLDYQLDNVDDEFVYED